MRAGATLGGISLVILGILMILFGSYTYTINIPIVESNTVFDKISFTVGDVKVYEADFFENVTVTCNASINIPTTGDAGDINFFVLRGEEFQRWKNGEKDVIFIIELTMIKSINTSFQTDKQGTYYFIFDNTFSELYKKEVTFSSTMEYLTYVEEIRENNSIVYIGYFAVVFGVIVTVYGLIRKPEVTWA
ncbi:MAG: hypothetical protein O2U61_01680 [Candidatus Bathyarchaeota archaeon]|nr:hypothetical protein [Candidatus Bathyarchaeota archaeon]